MKNFPGMFVQGLAVVAFAGLAGFGATALSGIPFSPLASSVVPFLALGLGECHDVPNN
jgi:predicted RND superfamily exporter protein